MITADAPSRDILAYLKEHTRADAASTGGGSGFYGVIRGEYLDGYGLQPEPPSLPSERPWYRAAAARGGYVTISPPYTDSLTGDSMFTFSKMLRDGSSVLALDVRLAPLENIARSVVSPEDGLVVVMNRSGEVLARSYSAWGADAAASEEFEKALPAALRSGPTVSGFELLAGGKTYMVFIEPIRDEWFTAVALDEKPLFDSLHFVYFFTTLFVVVVYVMLFALGAAINRKRLEAEKLNAQLSAMADIYVAMCTCDLIGDTYTPVKGRSDITRVVDAASPQAGRAVVDVMRHFCAPQSWDALYEFIRLDTIQHRLLGTNTITHEFLGNRTGWCLARFIVVDRMPDGRARHVLWLVESVDVQRRRLEQLRLLSETDGLTGIRNRTAGEAAVREKLAEGAPGMFLLIDVDRFKSINDSFGHDVGDRVLMTIATALRSALRSGDITLRLGGDEFVAYAPGVSGEQEGMEVLAPFFSKIGAIDIPELKGRTVSVSVGAAFRREGDGLGFDELYAMADAMTYESKKTPGCSVSCHRAG
ncbi:MAG: sensor domain-containing diguanylate cyclase [Mailhella sp.]|nr:sensor domain-containing diguanylate cyclase [Mailhella sp.]